MKGLHIDLEKFNQLKTVTREAYDKVGNVYCPALKSNIVFNADGFHHLRYDSNRSERSKWVQRSKFLCLNNAVEILKKTTTIQEYRSSICPVGGCDKSGFHKTKKVEWFGFLAIVDIPKGIRINIVIRKVGEDGLFHFWSVMPYWSLSNNKRVIGSRKVEDE